MDIVSNSGSTPCSPRSPRSPRIETQESFGELETLEMVRLTSINKSLDNTAYERRRPKLKHVSQFSFDKI